MIMMIPHASFFCFGKTGLLNRIGETALGLKEELFGVLLVHSGLRLASKNSVRNQ